MTLASPVFVFVFQVGILLTLATGAGAACIETIASPDEDHYFEIAEGDWRLSYSPRPISSVRNSLLIVEHPRNRGKPIMFTATVRPFGTFGWTCNSKIVVLEPGKKVALLVPAKLRHELVLVGPGGTLPLEYRLLSDIPEKYQANPDQIIQRPIDVLIFENHPIASKAKDEALRALAIWRTAGIYLVPRFQVIKGNRVADILGEDRTMVAAFNYRIMSSEDAREINKISDIRSVKDGFAIVFAKSNISGVLGTRADPTRRQVYIAGACDNNFPMTIAHELGHLLLGGGHTGKKNAKWTSSLMRLCNQGIGTVISEADAEMARASAAKWPVERKKP